jgi:hypothetical protein
MSISAENSVMTSRLGFSFLTEEEAKASVLYDYLGYQTNQLSGF